MRTIDGFKTSIRDAFKGDGELMSKFSDPNIEYSDLDELVNDVCKKIDQYLKLGECAFKTLETGYIFWMKDPVLLVSFGLNINNRSPRGLQKFWEEIVSNLGNRFGCFLWSNNTRAIKWLKRMGMQVVESNNSITRLQLCR